MGPHPAVAEIRRAIRAAVADLEPGDLVLVACSGGPDSLALARATAFEAPRAGLRAGLITVDHGLQPGSAERAAAVAATGREWGFDPAEAIAVDVGTDGGPEAAARTARYAALDAAAEKHGAAAVLLAHTRDDQAETVLLGLARGSGARSLAGMAPRSGRYRRPLLDVTRATVALACQAEHLQPWHDPHNADPAYARSRVRHEALPALEAALGPGIVDALARTATLLRADADALDALAAAAAAACAAPAGLDCVRLAEQPGAIRTRVLRTAAIAAGSPAGDLTAGHVEALDALVIAWRGQRWVDLPGAVRALRSCGTLVFVGPPEENSP
ncbi:tRNA lysidine(34) synthetase TilS [Sporichthya brevicatena]|uniref:tRNA(Ile)-lysidine synthase n=1 Tax=Sporichthya brevicatena TaxID=171442 RepID=A0ABN1GWG5_9ACTN